MMKKVLFVLLACYFFNSLSAQTNNAWIRINQLGYAPNQTKIAVLAGKEKLLGKIFQLVDASTRKVVYTGNTGKSFGSYGPFTDTYRLDFSSYNKEGNYFLKGGDIESPVFAINENVYDGAADFCLRYMRQQRSGFNPFLKDSCHTHDGYTLYAPVPDSTHVDVSGGWHDATDYLQYSTTSANATYHLLAAYRDFPGVFKDVKQANGLDGSNHIPDVLDEARWGLDWLLKMHPKDDWMFNQLGDDRDHKGMRLPMNETGLYGRGMERPVYFCNGEPQVRGKYKNNTTGVASTAGKFSSAFALGSELFFSIDRPYANELNTKSATAMLMGLKQPGACQTASVVTPYIYAEDNWTDDMELASAAGFTKEADWYKKTKLEESLIAHIKPDTSFIDDAYRYALKEKITPWLGEDTAKHYQWYPFINVGHYELAKLLKGKRKDSIIAFYRQGIERVWKKAKMNAFYHAIPFIWCSNNLTVSFAIQCYWYRQLSKDKTYLPLEQACFDWIFGCNPWGTGMVYGLPSWGDTPSDPHSSLSHLKNYPIDGGLVDGPVYTSIYSNLIGIELFNGDEYAPFQSGLAVYHDDYGDYSTNEPTMDGTASLIYLLAAEEAQAKHSGKFNFSHGGIVRGNSSQKNIALVFTGDEFGDGLQTITQTLQKQQIHGSFFFTGRFYRNKQFWSFIKKVYRNGNYMGPHSNNHLLYCDWNNRDSLLVTYDVFAKDMQQNLAAMKSLGIDTKPVSLYMPPYEWWNDTIAGWSRQAGLQVINFTPGITTNADYTYPEMGAAYKSAETLLQSLKQYEENNANGLNGAIILIHAGTDPRRKDKLYDRLNEIVDYLKAKGYRFKRVDELLK